MMLTVITATKCCTGSCLVICSVTSAEQNTFYNISLLEKYVPVVSQVKQNVTLPINFI